VSGQPAHGCWSFARSRLPSVTQARNPPVAPTPGNGRNRTACATSDVRARGLDVMCRERLGMPCADTPRGVAAVDRVVVLVGLAQRGPRGQGRCTLRPVLPTLGNR